jgi:oligopeptide transport system substrate-binding protein
LNSKRPVRRARWAQSLTLIVILLSGAWSLSAAGAQSQDALRLAGPIQGPETLDPAQTRDLSTVSILRQIYRGLMYYDDELNPVPELAESYEVTEDGLTYTFRLRPGATFQDGSPLTADDVAFSLARAVDPDTVEGDTSLLAGPSFLSDIAGYADVVTNTADELSGVQVVNDATLTISLAAPRATFLMKLAAVPAAIVSREEVESDSTWWARPNGSGPYRVRDWEPGESIELERYDEFVLGRPEIDRIQIRLGGRALQSFNLYQADEIDIDAVSLFDVDQVLDPNGEFADQVRSTSPFGFGIIAFRTDVEPLDDPHIREALQLVFPREELAEITFSGQVDVARGLIMDGMLGQQWEPVLPPTDPDAARKAITESKYGTAEQVPPIRIYTAGALAAEVLRDVAQEELGLTIEVLALEWFDFLDRLSAEAVPGYELYWAADYPDPESILLSLWGTGQPDNFTGYSNPEVDRVLAQAMNETDLSARAALYAEAQRLVLADNVVIPAYMDVQYVVIKPHVQNVTLTPLGILRYESISIDE